MTHSSSTLSSADLPSGRFLKTILPDLGLLALEFAAGMAMGAAGVDIAAHGHPDMGMTSSMFGTLGADKFIGDGFTWRLRDGMTPAPERALRCLSAIASFSGAIAGSVLTLAHTAPVADPDRSIPQALVLGVAGSLITFGRASRPYPDRVGPAAE